MYPLPICIPPGTSAGREHSPPAGCLGGRAQADLGTGETRAGGKEGNRGFTLTKGVTMKRALLVLLLVAAATQGQAGLRPGVGYVPGAGALVYHCDTSKEAMESRGCPGITRLDTLAPWDGSNADPGYVNRYMPGFPGCVGAWICGVGNENECLNSRAELTAMFKRGELGDPAVYDGQPTRVECHDYGAQRPELGRVGGSTGKLRQQPTTPEGCCSQTLPCEVSDPRRVPGERWVEPVRTPQGGRAGCNLIRAGAPVPTPAPTPTPTATPAPPPEGECAQKVTDWPEWLALLAKLGRCRP